MNIIKVKDHEQMSQKSATIIAAQLLRKPNSLLGLATGSTPVRTYEILKEMCAEGTVDFSQAISYNLDEYVGLSRDHDQSYYFFMMQKLFSGVNIDKAKVHVPNGLAKDTAAECAQYDAEIAQLGGIDIQLLGIGSNGHIGFNEPANTFIYETHKVDLSEQTINDNARFFASKNEVPKSALTMGMGSIMAAKNVLLIAGDGKQSIVEKMIYGDIDPKVPASILRVHKNVTVIYVTK